jgi:signal transduction histidine kinase
MKTIFEKFLKLAKNTYDIEWIAEDRLSLLLVGLLYPVWGLLSLFIGMDFPGRDRGIGGRFIVGGIALSCLLASYVFLPLARRLGFVSTLCLSLAVAHYFYLVHVNQGHITYVIGSFILVSSIGSLINHGRHMLMLGAVSLMAAWWAGAGVGSLTFQSYFFFGISSTLLVTYVASRRRIYSIKKEKQAQVMIAAQQAKIAASSRLSALGEMAGGIAHEINTPLATIVMGAELAGVLLESNPVKVKEILKNISVTVEKIAQIIRGLRSFSRDAENDPFVNTSMEQVLNDVLSLCQAKIRYQNIKIEVTKNLPEILIDCRPMQLAQILMNLINNSIFELKSQIGACIHIQILDLGENVRIIVADNGPGVPPELRAKIFQPFFTTKEVGSGTGLGLSISKGLVEAHNGKLELESSEFGARFAITMPKRQETSSKKAA